MRVAMFEVVKAETGKRRYVKKLLQVVQVDLYPEESVDWLIVTDVFGMKHYFRGISYSETVATYKELRELLLSSSSSTDDWCKFLDTSVPTEKKGEWHMKAFYVDGIRHIVDADDENVLVFGFNKSQGEFSEKI